MTTVFIIGIATVIVTALGGLFALRFKDRLHLIVGFSAGAVLGVAFFDLLPEAFELGETFREPGTTAAIIALGFLVYLLIDRALLLSAAGSEHDHAHEHRSNFGALSMSVHSFLDGLAIGFAFQVSPAIGIVVTLAVLVHDFSDGINTVNFSLLGSSSERRAKGWLLLDALAPLLGIVVTFFIQVSDVTLSIVLALFAGFFLYLGASELLPESHHRHPRIWTTAMTLLGVGVIYVVVQFAHF